MRLVCITDLHGRKDVLERILSDAGAADVVLLGGDLTNFGSAADAIRIVEAVRNAYPSAEEAPTVLAVAGNCDSAEIDRRLVDSGVGLHARGWLRGDVGIHGLSAIPPWKHCMYELSEESLSAALDAGYTEIQDAKQHVLLAHVPPRGLKVDRTFLRIHAGSTAVRTYVDRVQPAVVFCGHIHEGRGIETVGTTQVVNCGLGGHGEYAIAELTADSAEVTLRAVSA